MHYYKGNQSLKITIGLHCAIPEKWVPFNDPCGFVAYNHTTDSVYHLYTSEKYGLEGPHLLPKANKHEIDPFRALPPGGE